LQSFVDAMAAVGVTITNDNVIITFVGAAPVPTGLSRRLDATAATNVSVAIVLPTGTTASSVAAAINYEQVSRYIAEINIIR
jgi:hypothetical protein